MKKPEDATHLKAFAITTFEYLADILDPPSLGHEVRKAAEYVRQTDSLLILRQAVSDLTEWTRDLPSDRVAELEARLAAAKAPSLALMRDRAGRVVARVLDRGRAETEDEYRILMERLNDISDSGLSDSQRELGNRIVADYESRT